MTPLRVCNISGNIRIVDTSRNDETTNFNLKDMFQFLDYPSHNDNALILMHSYS